MSEQLPAEAARSLFEAHPRSFEANRYVYPVVSRRARGVSVGINLNLDKVCNFDCIYCQVDRRESAEREFLAIDRLAEELDRTVVLVTSGELFAHAKFSATPAELRRLNDIALSGDGEPTTYRNFSDVIDVCAAVRRRHALNDVKLVLITNATMFHRVEVQQALRVLDSNGGEIWAKLDAGTESYYRQVARAAIPFQRILDNLLLAARERPIVIQSLFMNIHNAAPPDEEIAAYCQRLGEIVAGGGQIKLVQIHTVARQPAETWVAPLSKDRLEAILTAVKAHTGLPAAVFA